MNKLITFSKKTSSLQYQEDYPIRLDRYLKQHFKYLPQSLIEKSIRKKNILLNQNKTSSNIRLQKGDNISFPDSFLQFKQENIKGDSSLFEKFKEWIIYEDHKICVINKPYNLSTQGGQKVKYSIDLMANSGDEKYYLVHRLDRYTTGLLLLAKTKAMASFLTSEFKARNIKKYYFTIVKNAPKSISGIIDFPILKKNIGGTEKMVLDYENGQISKTRYRVVKKVKEGYMLCIKLYTGRKHQIRAHLALNGMPVIGDKKYGGVEAEYMRLHAYKVILSNNFCFCNKKSILNMEIV